MGSDCERTYFYCRSIHNYRRSRRGTYTIGSDYSGIIGSVCIDWCWGSYNRSGFTCSWHRTFGTCYRIHSAGNCWCRWSDCNRSSTDSYRYWYRWLNSGCSYKSRRRNYRNLQSYCCRSASYWRSCKGSCLNADRCFRILCTAAGRRSFTISGWCISGSGYLYASNCRSSFQIPYWNFRWYC